MKKVIGIVGILGVSAFICAGSAFARIDSNEVQSRHIAEADGTSGQNTNSGHGVKTGHIQDGAVTDAKISDVSMEKVTGLDNALANPVLPLSYSEPYACEAEAAGAILLTGKFTTCVCNGTDWVSTADGSTSCNLPKTVTSAGQVWMDRNLGASQVATSLTDEAARGDLYQWGRGADGHQNPTSPTTLTRSFTDNPGHGNFILTENGDITNWRITPNQDLWQGVSGTNNPCPAGFRVPTAIDFETEMNTWEGDPTDAAYNSPLRLIGNGHRVYWDGRHNLAAWSDSYFWTSTSQSADSANAAVMNGGYMSNYDSAYGFSVRCIMD